MSDYWDRANSREMTHSEYLSRKKDFERMQNGAYSYNKEAAEQPERRFSGYYGHGEAENEVLGMTVINYPDYYRPYLTKMEEFKPNMCASLPKENEKVEVFIPNGKWPWRVLAGGNNEYTGDYPVPATATNVNEERCTFTAVPDDADKYPEPIAEHTFKSHYIFDVIGAGALAYVNDALKKDHDVHIMGKLLGTAPVKPKNGFFSGSSTEMVDGKKIWQEVYVTLKFRSNGRLWGNGHDSEDGKYKLFGTWTEDGKGTGRYMLAWKEKYDDFEVDVTAEFDSESNTITGKFQSTRDVGGKFSISRM